MQGNKARTQQPKMMIFSSEQQLQEVLSLGQFCRTLSVWEKKSSSRDVTQWHEENIMTGRFAKAFLKQWERLKGILREYYDSMLWKNSLRTNIEARLVVVKDMRRGGSSSKTWQLNSPTVWKIAVLLEALRIVPFQAQNNRAIKTVNLPNFFWNHKISVKINVCRLLNEFSNFFCLQLSWLWLVNN